MSNCIQISINKEKIEGLSGECLVVFSHDRSEKKQSAKISTAALEKRLKSSLDSKALTGKKAETLFFREIQFEKFSHVLVVGLGTSADYSEELVRQTMATVQTALTSNQVKEAFIQMDGLIAGNKDFPSGIQAAVEGLELAAYEFEELKSKPEEKTSEKKSPLVVHLVTAKATQAVVKSAVQTGQIYSECVNFSRRLGDLPGNYLTPTKLAEEAQSAAKGTGIKVTVWNKDKIVKEKMGGLYSVSKGSSQEPRFIIMEYKPAGSSKKPIVFVGKGLTFDSGGISIKPSASMEEMKYDMCGGANVIGTLLAIAKLKLKIHAVALIPATENMPGPDANKPGDIITARN
ncbi:MAG TPA: M17 family peptidase N-terminal domain-containing protein, partial [Pseudobdellovibrionaceae bacterium]|nr:M17 family peptidase N-terminal domain-containing protein [Pseudobdellovibrionaceae bacterium]